MPDPSADLKRSAQIGERTHEVHPDSRNCVRRAELWCRIFPDQPSTTSPIPPAVSTSNVDSKTSAAPVAGANSFAQSQAKKRIEAHGYSDVMELTKDDNSIWRGKATKGGKQVGVALDYQGNIVRY
jgi:hypothetical protein